MRRKTSVTWTELVTTHEAIRTGFIQQALQKSSAAEPYIDEGRQLADKLHAVSDPVELLVDSAVRGDLHAAVGLSEKAIGHLTPSELDNAILELLDRVIRADNENWRQEILFRFLLTRGDALGGRVRNLTGAASARQFVSILQARLAGQGISATATTRAGKTISLRWPGRLLVFDRKPRLLAKNVDLILLSSGDEAVADSDLLSDRDAYIACGELKGGIDPAGADEHWKTANSALGRIRTRFRAKRPRLFFAGAVIVEEMAKEIVGQLRKGDLNFAANLTSPSQTEALADWLLSL